jgi:hypothetical protein
MDVNIFPPKHCSYEFVVTGVSPANMEELPATRLPLQRWKALNVLSSTRWQNSQPEN